MPLLLNAREPLLKEYMDSPNANPALLFRTYKRFSIVNRLIAGWNRIFKTLILPMTREGETCRLLDIGFGGGDILRVLHRLAATHNLRFQITGIDIDRRALEFVEKLSWPDDIDFRLGSTTELVKENQSFDFIISNHLIHHLKLNDMRQMLNDCEHLCTRRIIHNDIERSDVAYCCFSPLSRLVSGNSFLRDDGLRSIRKSFTHSELSLLAPDDWTVYRMFPYRLLLVNG